MTGQAPPTAKPTQIAMRISLAPAPMLLPAIVFNRRLIRYDPVVVEQYIASATIA